MHTFYASSTQLIYINILQEITNGFNGVSDSENENEVVHKTEEEKDGIETEKVVEAACDCRVCSHARFVPLFCPSVFQA